MATKEEIDAARRHIERLRDQHANDLIALVRLVDDGALKGDAGDKLIADLRTWDRAFNAMGAAQRMFTDLTVSVLMRHGLFGDGSVPAATHPYRYKDFSPGSKGHFMADGGEVKPRAEMNADELYAYDEWLGLNEMGRVFGRPGESIALGFDKAENYSQNGS